ncbi:hypothetical protein [Streptomyces pinistramenti]|uniref:hypothetical protein n=1 Tax=Streptomyces pinistramenti TaxID=2884812 RepID=UPI001D0868BB|nr:hypothetical protein [Streptomyces pinistramenti]MCB5910393.1 hypothetical protein [Streptomyces pinistramenti]
MTTDFLGRPVADLLANTVTFACQLCPYLGPSFRVGTELADVLAPVGAHVREQHPDAGDVESYPKVIYGYVDGLTDEVLLRVNARRAENPYGDGTTCEPGCECGA